MAADFQRDYRMEDDDQIFAPVVVRSLRYWAQCMAARFNGEVWLIGSATYSPTPRDVDIRIVIADDEFRGRYQVEVATWDTRDRGQRWIDDMAKFNATLSRGHTLNCDVQVWPAGTWKPDCDGRSRSVLLAAPSPRRWVQQTPRHVCGARGFEPWRGDQCPACVKATSFNP